MRKLAVLIAIAMIAAFAAPAMATDVSVSGEFRTLAVYDDSGHMAATDGVDKYFAQRFRTLVTMKVNDNVTAFLRTDLSEEIWGEDATTGTGTFSGNSGKGDSWRRATAGTDTLQVDRAYVQIKSGIFTLKAGQQYAFTGVPGPTSMFEGQFFGFVGTFDLNPITIDLIYSKLDENTDRADGNQTAEDEDVYVAQLKYAADNFTLGGILGRRIDRSQAGTDNELTGYGLFGTFNSGIMTLKGELDIFDGDDTQTVDYYGTQMCLMADFAVTDTLTLGGAFLWAEGTDDPDTQATSLYQFGVINSPLEWEGELGGTTGGYGIANLYDIDSNSSTGRSDSGVVGIIGKAKFMATDALTLWAKVAYLEPEDDNANTALDNEMFVVGEANYQWMPNVTISGGFQFCSPNYKDNTINDDDEVMMTAKLGVSF